MTNLLDLLDWLRWWWWGLSVDWGQGSSGWGWVTALLGKDCRWPDNEGKKNQRS